jgi:futalosine hydrolase
MDILIVSATTLELPMLSGFIEKQMNNPELRLTWLVCGVGAVATTYALTAYLTNKRPDYIIQAGIGGSYDENVPPGAAVIINEEVFGDLGATENGKPVNIFDLKLAAPDDSPFTGGVLKNRNTFPGLSSSLKKVKGATVNAISSSKADADKIKEKYQAVVESMEGAAFHYVCIKENIPFLQLRAISNFAGERNKPNWKMKESIAMLHEQLISILSSLNE